MVSEPATPTVATVGDSEPSDRQEAALVVLVGPTASGKSSLAIRLAEHIGGEILSCDSVAIYRGLDVGSAKPTLAERARVPHHGLDLLDLDQRATAGGYGRYAREVLAVLRQKGRPAVLTGGTGLYLRAVLEGLAPAPLRDEALRTRLRNHAVRRGQGALHRLLRRFDPAAAALIHPHDAPKLIRSLEMTLLGQRPQTAQWSEGRDPLRGFRILQIGLEPPREALYARINARAAAMFSAGLVEETAQVMRDFGKDAEVLGSLGYAQARALLRGELTRDQAVAAAQQGHRNYAKRQLTWFRRDRHTEWLNGFGDDPATYRSALHRVEQHLMSGSARVRADGTAGK